MALILTILWPAVLAALALGGWVGAFAGLPRRRGEVVAAGLLAGVAALLNGLALVGPVAGRAGFWIEIFALCLDAYLAGCLAGAAAMLLARNQPATGAIGRR